MSVSQHSTLSLDDMIAKTQRSFSPEVVEYARKRLNKDASNWKDVAINMGYNIENLDYLYLSGAMIVEYMKFNGASSIDEYVKAMEERLDPEVVRFMKNHKTQLTNLMKKFEYRDYAYNFFSSMNLAALYMAKPSYDEEAYESPPYFYMRVVVGLFFDFKEGDPMACEALGITYNDTISNSIHWIENVYEQAVFHRINFATPTCFASGFKKSQKASCFLLTVGDNLEEILSAVNKMGQISKHRGGIGLDMSNLRHSDIGAIGMSSGIRNWVLLYDKLVRAVDQIGTRRGAATLYIRPHHPDCIDFASVVDKEERGNQESAQNIDNAFWLNWVFFKRLKGDKGGKLTLFCPSKAPSLNNIYGEEFMDEYERLENLYEEWKDKEGILKEYIRGARGHHKTKLIEEFKEEIDANKKTEIAKRIHGVDSDEERKHYKFLLGLIRFTKQIQAEELCDKMIEMQKKWGKPYLLNGDAANFKSNQKNLGYIRSSNLCVAPNTYILTKEGNKIISELEDQKVEIWNGQEWSEVVVKCTSPEPVKLITISFSDGSQLSCTPEHNFAIQRGDKNKGSQVKLQGKQLEVGDRLIKYKLPICAEFEHGNEEFVDPYTHGFFCGDGTYDNGKPLLSLYGEKKNLLQYLSYKSSSGREDSLGRLNLTLNSNLNYKYKVPINSSVETKLKWFAGYADADGCLVKTGNCQSLQIVSINKEFLDEIKYMLMTLGANAKIVDGYPEMSRLLPDGKGGKKEYQCKRQWRILLNAYELYKLHVLGIQFYRLQYDGIMPKGEMSHYVKVTKIDDFEIYEKTYCVTEPKRNMVVFNGNLVFNCVEIIEYTDKDEIATCNLGSLNLGKYVKFNDKGEKVVDFDLLGKNARLMITVLNRVIDSNYYPVEEARNSNMKHRPVGLGVCGWGDLLNEMRYPVDSPEAYDLNRKVAACIYFNSLVASAYLGYHQGNYSTFEGSPMSEGKLQFDLWQEEYKMLERRGLLNTKVRKWEDQIPPNPEDWGQEVINFNGSGRKIYPSWGSLKEFTTKYMRNSLLIARMPTASSASISGATESAEIHSSNIYTREVLSVAAPIVNKYMVEDLSKMDLWNRDVSDYIRCCDGSIAKLHDFIEKFPKKIPDYVDSEENRKKLKELQHLYRTIWEVSQKVFIEHAAQAGICICQSQSFNLWIPDPTTKQLKASLLMSADIGLKTCNYYVRRMAPIKPNASTVDAEIAELGANSRQEIFFKGKAPKKVTEVNKVKDEKREEIVEVCYPGCLSCQ